MRASFFYGVLCLCVGVQSFAENSQLLDCSIIFETRKNEIKAQLDEIDERQQALQVLQRRQRRN